MRRARHLPLPLQSNERKHHSKFLSLLLRHRPELAGLQLDAAGWVDVEVLLAGLARSGQPLTREQLLEIVATNDKKRFELDASGERIRAVQGHSVEVDLGYAPAVPPDVLLHGTHTAVLSAIRRQGLLRMQRHHVHLHHDPALAATVGGRRGQPVVLRVRAAAMAAAGHVFFVTPNRVWLTEHVPPEFLEFPSA